jgi:hypothetical protein
MYLILSAQQRNEKNLAMHAVIDDIRRGAQPGLRANQYYLYLRISPTTRPWILTRCGGLTMIGR